MATPNSGFFIWYDNLTRDVSAAIGFYSEVVGWKTQAFGDGSSHYTMWVGAQGPLDRIYFRGTLRLAGIHRCRLQVARLASDHLPVMAEFDLI